MVEKYAKDAHRRHGGPTARINAHRGEFRWSPTWATADRATPGSSPSANLAGVWRPAVLLPGMAMAFCRRVSPIPRPSRPFRSCCSSSASSASVVWLLGSRNPYTPAGYVGYLTKGAVFGQEPLLRRPDGADVARPHLAARRHQRQRHALHLHRGVRRRPRGAQPRQPEDLLRRAHRLARRRSAGSAVHGALQHDRHQRRHTRSRRTRS